MHISISISTDNVFCLARALHRILEWKNHGVKWFHHEIRTLDVLNMIVKRINEASVSFGKISRIIICSYVVQPELYPGAI